MAFLDFLKPKPKLLNSEQFAQMMCASVNSHSDRVGQVDEERFRICLFDQQGRATGFMGLGNIFAEYIKAEPSKREALLAYHLVSSLKQPRSFESFSEAAPFLMPIVKTRAQAELAKLAIESGGFGDEASLPTLEVSSTLNAHLALDEEAKISQIVSGQITRWQVSEAVCFQTARENLRKRSETPWVELSPGVYRSPWRDNYDGARLLFKDLVRTLSTKGDPVVFHPSRSCLIVTGSADLDGIAIAMQAALTAREEDRPISLDPLILRNDAWETIDIEELFPPSQARTDYARAMALQLSEQYALQKESLSPIVDVDDVFVVTYTLLENQSTGLLFSQSLWLDGIVSLLPLTDTIRLGRVRGGLPGQTTEVGDELEFADVPRERVVAAAGELLEATYHHPTRYAVSAFPTPEQLATMGAAWE